MTKKYDTFSDKKHKCMLRGAIVNPVTLLCVTEDGSIMNKLREQAEKRPQNFINKMESLDYTSHEARKIAKYIGADMSEWDRLGLGLKKRHHDKKEKKPEPAKKKKTPTPAKADKGKEPAKAKTPDKKDMGEDGWWVDLDDDEQPPATAAAAVAKPKKKKKKPGETLQDFIEEDEEEYAAEASKHEYLTAKTRQGESFIEGGDEEIMTNLGDAPTVEELEKDSKDCTKQLRFCREELERERARTRMSAMVAAATVADGVAHNIIKPAKAGAATGAAIDAVSRTADKPVRTQIQAAAAAAVKATGDDSKVKIAPQTVQRIKYSAFEGEETERKDTMKYHLLHTLYDRSGGQYYPDSEEHEKIRKQLKKDEHPLASRRIVGPGTCRKFVFMIGAGASNDAPARIPTFRGDSADTGIIVNKAIKTAKKYYPKSKIAREMYEMDRNFHGSASWENVFSNTVQDNYPLVIMEVMKSWIDSIKGRAPNMVHHLMKWLQDKHQLSMVSTMNVDNLEIAAGIDLDSLVISHGCVFIGKDKDKNIVGWANGADVDDEGSTSVVTVGGYQIDSPETEEELIDASKGSCLVIVGVSSAIIPDWLPKARPSHVIIADPSKKSVDQIMELFPESMRDKDEMWDAYSSVESMIKHVFPDFKLPANADSIVNTSKISLERAVRWFKQNADDFPYKDPVVEKETEDEGVDESDDEEDIDIEEDEERSVDGDDD